MKKSIRGVEIFSVIFLALIIGLTVIGLPRTYQTDKVIVAFGDSLTRGYGTPPGKNFVTFLSESVGIPIINSGKTGDTTADALVRLKEDVLDYHPDIAIVLLGANDFLSGYGEEVVQENIRTVIRKIKSAGSEVILVGVYQDFNPKYEKVLEKLSWEEKVGGYVPNVLGGILFRKDLLYDTLHPNERGHEIIADRILPALEKVLREL